jgi:arylsulfatase
MMEVYAAAVAQCDAEIGRILDDLESAGQLDNTLVIFIEGDNGASAEGTMQGTTNEMGVQLFPESIPFLLSMIDELGSDKTYNHYPIGWAHAMDTPFQWTKQVASHFGGTRNGIAISWPNRIAANGEIRTQFGHVIDIVPTILEAVGVEVPLTLYGTPQKPMEGVSMVYTFADAQAPTRHPTQYFEISANRALYHGGWIASTTPLRKPWETYGQEPDPDDFQWELYDISKDFSQSSDVAKENPKKLAELQALFLVEAAKYNVLPLDSSFASRADPASRPHAGTDRTAFTYYPDMIRITEASAPNIKNRSFRIAAEIDVPAGGAEGVIVTQGGRFAGWAMLVLDGKPMFAYALSNPDGHLYPGQEGMKTRFAGRSKLTRGRHVLAFDFTYDGGGIGRGGRGVLSVDGKTVAEGRLERTIPIRFSLDESFDIGLDTGSPVIDEYDDRMPFKFTGDLKKVDITLGPDGVPAEQHAERARQKGRLAMKVQ